MAARLEVKEKLNRQLHVTVPRQEWQDQSEVLLKQRAKTAKVDGFRPGKAPPDVVRKMYGASIEEKALDQVMGKYLYQAYQEHALQPVGQPVIESLTAEPQQDIEFVASFEVEPAIEAIAFADAELEQIESEVTAEDVDKVVSSLQEQMGSFVVKVGPAANGDRLDFDFCGYVDGEAFDGGKAEHFSLVLGKGQMIPGFEEALLGLQAGEDKRIAVTFPDTYPAPLTSKAAEFDIHVHQVEEHVKGEVTEAFCRTLGVQDGQIDTLRSEIRATLEREMHKTLRNKVREVVFNKLIELNAIDVPSAEVHDEVHQLMDKAKERFKEMAPQQKNIPDFPHDMFEVEAKKRVQLGYLVRGLVRLASLEVSDTEVRVLAEELAGSYENPAEVIRYHLDNKERYNQLKALALEHKAVQHLLSLAKVTIKKVPHSTLNTAV